MSFVILQNIFFLIRITNVYHYESSRASCFSSNPIGTPVTKKEWIQSKFNIHIHPFEKNSGIKPEVFTSRFLGATVCQNAMSVSVVITESGVTSHNATPTCMASLHVTFFNPYQMPFQQSINTGFGISYSVQSLNVPTCQVYQFNNTYPYIIAGKHLRQAQGTQRKTINAFQPLEI